MIRNHRWLSMLLLSLLLSACAAFRPEPPEVQLAAIEISDLSLSHANFLATLNLYNPNHAALDIEGVEFALFLADMKVARGVSTKPFAIEAEQTGTTALRLSTSFLDLIRLASKLKDLDQVPFRIAGSVKVAGPGFLWMNVPISSEGELPLSGTMEQLLSAPRDFRHHQPPGDSQATPDAAGPTKETSP